MNARFNLSKIGAATSASSNRFPLSRLLACLALAALAGLLSSCASIDATTSEYVGASHYPPTSPANVEILRAAPTQPHERLGEVVIDASTEPSPPVSDVEKRLREEAAKLGADAAVVVYDRIQPIGLYATGGYWDRDIQTVTGRKLIGVAIKYGLAPTGKSQGYSYPMQPPVEAPYAPPSTVSPTPPYNSPNAQPPMTPPSSQTP